MPSTLDDVARALTEPISRRRALRLAAAAAVTSFVTVRPGSAAAAVPQCPPRENHTFTKPCSYHSCCHPDATCCIGPQDFANCCYDKDGQTCEKNPPPGRRPKCVCKPELECGGACCSPGEKCVDLELGRCCKIECGKECCDEGQKCSDPRRGVCCDKSEKACIGDHATVCCESDAGDCCAGTAAPFLTSCCGIGQICSEQGFCDCKRGRFDCLGDDCCRRRLDRCCPGFKRKAFCTPKQNKCCGDTVAFRGQKCCAGRFPYDPKTQRCCGLSGVCPGDDECCPGGCCPEGTNCCGNKGCCDATGAPVGRRRPFVRVHSRREQSSRRHRTGRRKRRTR